MSRGATSRRNAEALALQPIEASPAQLVLHSILVARCCHVLAHRDVDRVVGDARPAVAGWRRLCGESGNPADRPIDLVAESIVVTPSGSAASSTLSLSRKGL
jgi:hypothetical protein